MLIQIRSWDTILTQLKSTFLRFPLPIFCALGASVLAVLLSDNINVLYKTDIYALFLTLLYSFLSLTSLKLVVESHRLSIRTHVIATLAILTVIVLFTWGIAVETNRPSYLFFSLSVIVSFLCVPYINKNSSPASYWYFNYISGVAVFFATVASVVLGIGLSLILLSISYLFGVDIAVEFYTYIWLLACGTLFSIYFLSNISTEFDFEDEDCGFPKGISFITNYILVPLMWVYMAILYAYFLKIVFQWQLPRGNLGWIITAFGTIGIVTKLLAFPIRNDGTRLLQLFDKYYYYALIVPIILLATAIGIRIYDYGITESRYAVVLLGVWFSSVTILNIFQKNHFHIKYVPLIFALLAFFASFGPWGALEMSSNSQVNRFETVLIKHGLLVNGQAIKLSGELSFDERKALSSMADYVVKSEYTRKQIIPWFQTLINEADAKLELAAYRHYSSKQLIELMRIEYNDYWHTTKDKVERFTYYSGSNNLNTNIFDVSNFDYLAGGTVYFHRDDVKDKKFKVKYKNNIKVVSIGQLNESIVIKVDQGEQLNFDMEQVIVNLKKQRIKTINSKNRHHLTLYQSTSNKDLSVQLLIERIVGTVPTNKKIDIRDVHYIIMLKFHDR